MPNAYFKFRDLCINELLFHTAVETLKKFEKNDSKMQSQAAVNLSFLYFLEGETEQAGKHADAAMTADRCGGFIYISLGSDPTK